MDRVDKRRLGVLIFRKGPRKGAFLCPHIINSSNLLF